LSKKRSNGRTRERKTASVVSSAACSRSSSPGASTLIEILSQPLCWTTCLKDLQENGTLKGIAARFSGAQEWLFVGCGSSYYVAQAAAATMTALTAKPSRAVAASEILLFPELILIPEGCLPVLISRSGRTSEVLKVAELLRARGIDTLGISCAPGQKLETLVTTAIVLPPADEQSTVMTRSFTSMLMALQALAATICGREDFLASQQAIIRPAEKLLDALPRRVSKFVQQHQFADYVCLGQGPLFGIACESALKLTEMSLSYGQNFHTLEFRHGPKSIVSKDTLIMFLLSESGFKSEVEVLEEIKALGGTIMVVANRASERVRAAADLLIELNIQAPELARLPLYLPPQQLMGLYTGLKKGLDPDNPKNLSRVVLLADESSETSEHATL
jgi:glucosamine--fructose-6-phosphate aminotransferase (isomerizing)